VRIGLGQRNVAWVFGRDGPGNRQQRLLPIRDVEIRFRVLVVTGILQA
jgi:hypothetical protein